MPYKDKNSPEARESSRKAAIKYYAKRAAESEEFRQANRDRVEEWRATHHEQSLEGTREWRRRFRERDPEGFLAYERNKSKIARDKVRAEVIAAYGGHCKCCNDAHNEFLSMDHIHGGGRKHRKSLGSDGFHFYLWLKKQGFPQGDYRLLCMNCNTSLGFRGYCPHERERQAATVTPEASLVV